MSKGGEARYFFRSSKACRHSSDQEKSFICLKVLKNGRHLLADLEINRLSAVILPFNCCTSFVFGCFMSMIAFIFLKLTSISRCEIKNPKKFFEVMVENGAKDGFWRLTGLQTTAATTTVRCCPWWLTGLFLSFPCYCAPSLSLLMAAVTLSPFLSLFSFPSSLVSP